MYRDGKWVTFETSVCWLEIDPNDEEGLVEVVMTFSTIEERQEYIEARVNTGVVYDLLWWTESNYGGEPRPDLPHTEETLASGFAGGE